jgi:hypothetical protein
MQRQQPGKLEEATVLGAAKEEAAVVGPRWLYEVSLHLNPIAP